MLKYLFILFCSYTLASETVDPSKVYCVHGTTILPKNNVCIAAALNAGKPHSNDVIPYRMTWHTCIGALAKSEQMCITTSFMGIPLSLPSNAIEKVPYAFLLPFSGAYGGSLNDCMFVGGKVTLGQGTYVILPESSQAQFREQNPSYEGAVITYGENKTLSGVVSQTLEGIGAYELNYSDMQPNGEYKSISVKNCQNLDIQTFFNRNTSYQGHHITSGFGRIESLLMPLANFLYGVSLKDRPFEKMLNDLLPLEEFDRIRRLIDFEFSMLDSCCKEQPYTDRKNIILKWLSFYSDLLVYEVSQSNYDEALCLKRAPDGVLKRQKEVGQNTGKIEGIFPYLESYITLDTDLICKLFSNDAELYALLLKKILTCSDNKTPACLTDVIMQLGEKIPVDESRECLEKLLLADEAKALQVLKLPIPWHLILQMPKKESYDLKDLLPILGGTAPFFEKSDEWSRSTCLKKMPVQSYRDAIRIHLNYHNVFDGFLMRMPLNAEIKASFHESKSLTQVRLKGREFIQKNLQMDQILFDFEWIKQESEKFIEQFLESEKDFVGKQISDDPLYCKMHMIRFSLQNDFQNLMLHTLLKAGHFGAPEEIFDSYGVKEVFRSMYPNEASFWAGSLSLKRILDNCLFEKKMKSQAK